MISPLFAPFAAELNAAPWTPAVGDLVVYELSPGSLHRYGCRVLRVEATANCYFVRILDAGSSRGDEMVCRLEQLRPAI